MDSQTDLRAALTDAEACLATAQRARDLSKNQLDESEVLLRQAHMTVSAAKRAIQVAAQEPVDRALLEQKADLLHSRLRTAPTRSPTVQRVRSQLERLTDEGADVGTRLNLAKSLLSDLESHRTKDREIWDKNTPKLSGC